MARPDRHYKQRLQILQDARPPSSQVGLEHCNECGLCCIISPCKLRGMRDIKRLAKHLGMSPKHVARTHLAITTAAGGVEVRMRRRDESDSLSPCAFLGEDFRCGVHAAKPAGGKEFKCWDAETRTLVYTWDQHALDKLQRLTK